MRRTRSTCGPASTSLPTLVSFFAVALGEAALLARLRLGLVGGGLDLALEHRGAVGLGLDLTGEQRPVGAARALRLELVAEGDRAEVLRLALALELEPRRRTDPLRVRDDALAEAELGVAVHFLATPLVRLLLGEEARSSPEPPPKPAPSGCPASSRPPDS